MSTAIKDDLQSQMLLDICKYLDHMGESFFHGQAAKWAMSDTEYVKSMHQAQQSSEECQCNFDTLRFDHLVKRRGV